MQPSFQISAAPFLVSERIERVRIQRQYTNSSQLTAFQLQQANNLNYYAERIEAHAKAIEKLNKVLDKLDRLLSQRKLRDYTGSDTRSEAQNKYNSGSHEEQ